MEHIKVVICGDSGCGKTSIVTKKITGDHNLNVETTIGACFNKIKIDNYDLNIWDTAGQERFRSLIPLYFRQGQIFIVIFDISRDETFNNITSWVKEIGMHVVDPVIIVVGNKLDLNPDYVIPQIEYPIILTSVKHNKNIDQLFNLIIKTYTQNNKPYIARVNTIKIIKNDTKLIDWLDPRKYTYPKINNITPNTCTIL
jgi:small GTP-binding protein